MLLHGKYAVYNESGGRFTTLKSFETILSAVSISLIKLTLAPWVKMLSLLDEYIPHMMTGKKTDKQDRV